LLDHQVALVEDATLRFLRKLRISLPQDPAIPLLGIFPKDAKSYYKRICPTMFIAALFVIAKTWKQPRCPSTEEWIKKNLHPTTEWNRGNDPHQSTRLSSQDPVEEWKE
ncbi:LINE-1 retrotransposable element ORF2 protein, partial [Lemmus lemmus]